MDAADGAINGRARTLIECPKCHRHISPRRGKCIYCGSVCSEADAFEAR
jgi:ribosomal protein L37AE/L43A